MNIIKSIKKFILGTYTRIFFFSYLGFLMTSSVMLYISPSLQAGVELSFIDALFTAASALSTTGLSTIVVRDTFSLFGQIVLLLIIQIGGLGLIMMVSLFWLIVRKRIGFKQRNMIMTDQNQLSREGVVRFVRSVIIVILSIQLVAFAILYLHFVRTDIFPYGEALLQAAFLTVSFFTNAGFDISPEGASLSMFHGDYVLQSMGMLLIFLGAVGFWPLVELKEFLLAKWHKEKFKFSPFVKLLVILHFSIWLLSGLVFYALEHSVLLEGAGIVERLFTSLFMSLTARNAGFSTVDVNDMTQSTHILYLFLMFVGASPNSAGGGIRTTTLFVAAMSVISFSRGYDTVVYKEKTIKSETIRKSFVALSVAVVFVFTTIFLMSIIDTNPLPELVFEVVSAFGTTGLSLGITSSLSTASKILLIITMFVGRVGIVATLLIFKPSTKKKGSVQYPETEIIVG